ncbi:uncharacterized protein BO97DRAFT_16775 [Aspergillus homomorphus CBS 101889]|uniref:Uncharacterized protein n=1 Tax=Aspergillus homomorphus (strain CBS 101889) TaxID=1450537 RepID=A0A395I1D9_ASPHC|nr:hypothetical protein BO97DRAFT_16775 [Aspergillus homomorphus CBS 101889]RAL13991.1 hypothetical protein BO97DRAFT_16775 [Aspergillus homomorphus CBS 101889]
MPYSIHDTGQTWGRKEDLTVGDEMTEWGFETRQTQCDDEVIPSLLDDLSGNKIVWTPRSDPWLKTRSNQAEGGESSFSGPISTTTRFILHLHLYLVIQSGTTAAKPARRRAVIPNLMQSSNDVKSPSIHPSIHFFFSRRWNFFFRVNVDSSWF